MLQLFQLSFKRWWQISGLMKVWEISFEVFDHFDFHKLCLNDKHFRNYICLWTVFFLCEAIGSVATPGLLWQPRVIVKMIWRSRWNAGWQGKPKFSEKTCPSATFVLHKILYDQTSVWTRAAAVGSRRLTAWAMARPFVKSSFQYVNGQE
jgi:hypothetical protein